MKRRSFLKLISGAALAAPFLSAKSLLGETDSGAEPWVKKRWISDPDCFFTYPHSNGFIPGSTNIVIGHMDQQNITLLDWDFINDRKRSLFTQSLSGRAIYADIADGSGELTMVQDLYKIMVLQTKGDPKPQTLHTVSDGDQIVSRSVSFSPDGQRILFCRRPRNTDSLDPNVPHTVAELDRASRRVTDLFTLKMPLDHFQFSPHDPSWVGFCHNGNVKLTDRIWAWNKEHQNPPAAIWDQRTPTGPLNVGHERWMFDRTGIIAVAYGSSAGSPRGLYFIDPIQKAEKLISESSCDMHCNIDRTGKWAVVDTLSAWMGSANAKGPDKEPDGRWISDVVLVNFATGRRFKLARSHRKDHPWHAHPHISPDGRFVVYNDFQHDGANTPSRTIVLELDLPALDRA